ncbi:MAG: hypothetical protein CMH56_03895 [Myxococcales bacterium]|nr:hypothetical protein [Myxococcales bacterium]
MTLPWWVLLYEAWCFLIFMVQREWGSLLSQAFFVTDFFFVKKTFKKKKKSQIFQVFEEQKNGSG